MRAISPFAAVAKHGARALQRAGESVHIQTSSRGACRIVDAVDKQLRQTAAHAAPCNSASERCVAPAQSQGADTAGSIADMARACAEALLSRFSPMLAMYLYFASLVALLMLLQGGVATCPLVLTLRADRYRSRFYVTPPAQQPDQAAGTGGRKLADTWRTNGAQAPGASATRDTTGAGIIASQPLLACQSPASDAHGLLRWSVGNFCPPNAFSNLRDCSSECRLTKQPPASLACAEISVQIPQQACGAFTIALRLVHTHECCRTVYAGDHLHVTV